MGCQKLSNIVNNLVGDIMSVEELERARGDAAAAAEAGQQLLKTLAEVRQEKEHALQQVHQLRLSLDSKEKTVENLQEEVANLKVDQSKAIQAKDEEILELKRGRSILQDEMSQSVDGLVLQLQEKSLEAEEGNTALKKLQLELKEAQAKLENQDGCGGSVGSSRLRTAEETIEVLTEKLNQVEAEKERLGEAQESLLKDNTDLAERVEGLTTELSAVKMSLEETENELVGYQASMTQVKVEMDQMQSKLQEGDAACQGPEAEHGPAEEEAHGHERGSWRSEWSHLTSHGGTVDAREGQEYFTDAADYGGECQRRRQCRKVNWRKQESGVPDQTDC